MTGICTPPPTVTPSLLHKWNLPAIKPGDRKTCLSPASEPFVQKVEFTSTSGQNFLKIRYWNATLWARGVPSLSMWFVGTPIPTVV